MPVRVQAHVGLAPGSLNWNQQHLPFPNCTPMPLGRVPAAFDHRDWIFEIKYDGFRSLAFVDGDCRLVSRKGNTYKSFQHLAAELARIVPQPAILDGEIVALDSDGKPRFNDLLRRKGEMYFAAFDLVWLDGTDFRSTPLIERKRVLRTLVPVQPSRLLYVQHQAAEGVRLFDAACRMDLEGLVAKLADGKYTPESSTWVKIKNPAYSQAEGRRELFEARQAKAMGA